MANLSELDSIEDKARQFASAQRHDRSHHKLVVRSLASIKREQTTPILVLRLWRGEARFYLHRGKNNWQDLPNLKALVTKGSRETGKPGKADRLFREQRKQFLKLTVNQLENWRGAGLFEWLILVGEQNNLVALQELLSEKLLQRTVRVEGDNPDETRGELLDRIELEMA